MPGVRPEQLQPVGIDFTKDGKYAFVALGPSNRVAVIDTETLTLKRMWGGYGNKPDDKNLGPYNPDAPLAQQFRLAGSQLLGEFGESL